MAAFYSYLDILVFPAIIFQIKHSQILASGSVSGGPKLRYSLRPLSSRYHYCQFIDEEPEAQCGYMSCYLGAGFAGSHSLSSPLVVCNQGRFFCLPGDVLKYLETFLDVIMGGCYWHPVGRGQDAARHQCTVQPLQQRLIELQKVMSGKVEKSCSTPSKPGGRVVALLCDFPVVFHLQGQAVAQLCSTIPNVTVFGTASTFKHEAIKDSVTHLFDRNADYVQEVKR